MSTQARRGRQNEDQRQSGSPDGINLTTAMSAAMLGVALTALDAERAAQAQSLQPSQDVADEVPNVPGPQPAAAISTGAVDVRDEGPVASAAVGDPVGVALTRVVAESSGGDDDAVRPVALESGGPASVVSAAAPADEAATPLPINAAGEVADASAAMTAQDFLTASGPMAGFVPNFDAGALAADIASAVSGAFDYAGSLLNQVLANGPLGLSAVGTDFPATDALANFDLSSLAIDPSPLAVDMPALEVPAVGFMGLSYVDTGDPHDAATSPLGAALHGFG